MSFPGDPNWANFRVQFLFDCFLSVLFILFKFRVILVFPSFCFHYSILLHFHDCPSHIFFFSMHVCSFSSEKCFSFSICFKLFHPKGHLRAARPTNVIPGASHQRLSGSGHAFVMDFRFFFFLIMFFVCFRLLFV